MKWITLGALLGLLLVLCPAAVLTAAANPLVIAFALGVAARPAITRHIHGWTA
jgi:hypothetical protein